MSNPEMPKNTPPRKHSVLLPIALTTGALLLGGGVDAGFNDGRVVDSMQQIVKDRVGGSSELPPAMPGLSPSASKSAAASQSPKASRSSSSASTQPKKSSSAPAGTKPDKAAKPVIVIDPGHSGKDHDVMSKVQANGKTYTVRDHDYPNYPEIYETFAVSQCAATVLKADGYDVLLTKKKALGTVSLARRAEIANNADADLAISVHDDHGQAASFEAVYDQKGTKHNGVYPTLYRDAKVGSHSARLEFNNPQIATASHKAAKAIAAERAKAQGHEVSFAMANLADRSGLAGGNVWMVQALSQVPWVYNEMGALTDGNPPHPISLATEKAYATGLIEGVRNAVPIAGAPDDSPHIGSLSNCLESQQAAVPSQYRSR